jgi:hypothetical protein
MVKDDSDTWGEGVEVYWIHFSSVFGGFILKTIRGKFGGLALKTIERCLSGFGLKIRHEQFRGLATKPHGFLCLSLKTRLEFWREREESHVVITTLALRRSNS